MTTASDGHIDMDMHIFRRPSAPIAADIIDKLREYGWTEDTITPEMRQCIEEIAEALAEDQ